MLPHPVISIVLLLALVWQIQNAWPLLQVWYRGRRGRRATVSSFPTAPPPCQGMADPVPAAEPPPLIRQRRGRPRSVDTSKHYGPNRQCRYYGWRGRGNIRANGRPNGGRWRQLQCTVCKTYLMETWGTPFYRSRMAVVTACQMLKALAERWDIRAVARVFDVDPNSVQAWLRRAAAHIEALRPHLLHDLKLSQVQLDELRALLGRGGRWLARHACWV